MKISAYLKEKRQDAALTQRQASHLLGYKSSQFLSNLERGCSKPPAKVLGRLCEIYSVSEKEMFEAYLNHSLEQAERKARVEWNRIHTGKTICTDRTI